LIVDPSGDAPAELRALDATTGAEVWSREVGDLAEWFAPVKIAEGTLYVVRGDGAIAAFDAATGEERWSTTVAASGTAAGAIPLDANGDPLIVLGDVAIADGQLIVPVGLGEVVALDDATGRERWRFDAGERYGRTPVAILPAANGDAIALNILSDDRAVQPPIGGESKPLTVTVAVVEAATGVERWARSLTGDFAPLGLTGDTVAVALGPRVATELIGLDVATGETRWESTTSDEYVTFSLGGAGDDRLYLTDAGALRALDTTTGEEVWRVEVGTGTYLPPAITDGVVVVLNDRGVIGVTGSERLADPTSAEVARPDAAPSDQPATPESADSAQPTGR
jgi:outer membrane protein assembly factor BamB